MAGVVAFGGILTDKRSVFLQMSRPDQLESQLQRVLVAGRRFCPLCMAAFKRQAKWLSPVESRQI